jgi:hypothetical protein
MELGFVMWEPVAICEQPRTQSNAPLLCDLCDLLWDRFPLM